MNGMAGQQFHHHPQWPVAGTGCRHTHAVNVRVRVRARLGGRGCRPTHLFQPVALEELLQALLVIHAPLTVLVGARQKVGLRFCAAFGAQVTSERVLILLSLAHAGKGTKNTTVL